MNLPVYLDYNATTPCDPSVLQAMLPYFSEQFGNAASRSHRFGWQAEEAVEISREQVASLIGAEPKEIVFTSGATESDNLAIKGIWERFAGRGNHILTVSTEHKAVLDSCRHLQKLGASVTYLPVDGEGLLDLAELEAAIRPETILISVMYANNEIGVIQPIAEIGALAKRRGVLFHCDATQAVGKIPVDVQRDGIDCMAFSAHKIYGPKGVGALYVRRRDPRVSLIAQMDGGNHERGLRSGTLNVPGIVGFGKACAQCSGLMPEESIRLSNLRDQLEESLSALEFSQVNGSRARRLPQVTNMSFDYVDGESLLMGLQKELAVSSGSACTSALVEPSYVLKALGLPDDLAHGSLRFALGRQTTLEEVDFASESVKRTVNLLRKSSPLRPARGSAQEWK
jgi:cysteine desulfurase